MNTKTIDILSTVAISVGSFLLGGSLGLALNDCRNCNHTSSDILDENEAISASQMMFDFGAVVSNELISNIEKNKEDYKKLFDEETLNEYKRQLESYDTISDNEEDDIFEEKEEIDSIEIDDTIVLDTSEDEDIPDGEPYIISRDSFENEYTDFAKESLVYFEDDDTLSTDRDEVILDIDDIVGSDALLSFGEGSDDEDIVYVRNPRLKIDYEVVREHTSYAENVVGLTVDENYSYKEARKYFGIDEE